MEKIKKQTILDSEINCEIVESILSNLKELIETDIRFKHSLISAYNHGFGADEKAQLLIKFNFPPTYWKTLTPNQENYIFSEVKSIIKKYTKPGHKFSYIGTIKNKIVFEMRTPALDYHDFYELCSIEYLGYISRFRYEFEKIKRRFIRKSIE